ncbi:hypothetical protein GJ496_005413 [Pomphorhynchus laevis]|nr:hypothetical protein GJ496_005413 [Pomphorhynchus laevis]
MSNVLKTILRHFNRYGFDKHLIQLVTAGNALVEKLCSYSGLSDLSLAQNKIKEAESNLESIQMKRSKLQDQMKMSEEQIYTLRKTLNRHYLMDSKQFDFHDQFIESLQQKQLIITRQKELIQQIKQLNAEEKNKLLSFINALRYVKEVERLNNVRIRHYSLIGSILGLIGGLSFGILTVDWLPKPVNDIYLTNRSIQADISLSDDMFEFEQVPQHCRQSDIDGFRKTFLLFLCITAACKILQK